MCEQVIVHFSFNLKGGVGTVIENLANEQVRNNIVYIVCREKETLRNFDSRIKFINLEKASFYGQNLLLGMEIGRIYDELAERYKKKSIIVHCHNVAAVGLFSNIKKIPLICTLHGITGNLNSNFRTKVQTFLIKLILKKLERNNKIICAVSKKTCEYYINRMKIKNIKTILNGVEVIRKDDKKISEKIILGYIGDISKDKGVDILVNIFERITSEQVLNLGLIIAGREVDFNIPRKLGIEYKGYIKGANEKIIPNIDILILLSKSEGMPMVILEAMGNKKAIIATNVGGISEVVKNGINGYLVSRKEDEIIHSIKKIVSDRRKLEMMQQASFDIYQKKFTRKKMNEEYIKVYKKIKGGKV